jgi:hypothetical protein
MSERERLFLHTEVHVSKLPSLESLEAAVAAFREEKENREALDILQAHLALYKEVTTRATRAELKVATSALELNRLRASDKLFLQLSWYLVQLALSHGWKRDPESDEGTQDRPLCYDAALALNAIIETTAARARTAEARLAVYEAASGGVDLSSYQALVHANKELQQQVRELQSDYDEAVEQSYKAEELLSEVRSTLERSSI